MVINIMAGRGYRRLKTARAMRSCRFGDASEDKGHAETNFSRMTRSLVLLWLVVADNKDCLLPPHPIIKRVDLVRALALGPPRMMPDMCPRCCDWIDVVSASQDRLLYLTQGTTALNDVEN